MQVDVTAFALSTVRLFVTVYRALLMTASLCF